ncbi:hypothetical protein Tsubulata_025281, partial [Turnera subulata]
ISNEIALGAALCPLSVPFGLPHQITLGIYKIPQQGTGGCSYIKRMRVLENSPFLKKPERAYTYADEYKCYDVRYEAGYVEDPDEFYYEGPGQNPMCP